MYRRGKAPGGLGQALGGRTVGAARWTRTPFALRMFTSERRVDVFPVPGPPVRIDTLLPSAFRTAWLCSSWKWKPALDSAHPRAASTLIGGSPLWTRMSLETASAIFASARSRMGSWTRPEPGSGASSDAGKCRASCREATSASMRAVTRLADVSRSPAARSRRATSPKAVWPSSWRVSMAKRTPASSLGAASLANPRLMAILSAVLNPIPSISRATR